MPYINQTLSRKLIEMIKFWEKPLAKIGENDRLNVKIGKN